MRAGAAFFIALRYLLGRAKEGGRYLRGAAAGIALSLVPIIVTLVVADGMIRGITDRYLELGTGHIQIQNFMEPEFSPNSLEKIKTLTGLRGVWEEMHGLGVLVGSGSSRGASIRAVDESFWDDEGSLKYLKTISGEAKITGNREVLLGEELASSINAETGSAVRIMTVNTEPDGRSLPRVQVFTVKGIISSGYKELDSLWCIMSLEAGKQFLPENISPHLILKIDDPYGAVDDASVYLNRLLGSGYSVYTWKQLQRSVYSSYESTRQILLFIMAIIVLVAAVNVSSACSMLAMERQKDIAVLKTTGASPRFSGGIFLFGAFLTGLSGTIAGISISLILAFNINAIIRFLEMVFGFFTGLFNGDPLLILESGYYLETIPVVIDWTAVCLIAVFTIICSMLASGIPAARAGKLKVLDILHKY